MSLVSLPAIKDATAVQGRPIDAFGLQDWLVVQDTGRTSQMGVFTISDCCRSYLQFDLSALAGKTINSATFGIVHFYTISYGSGDVYMSRVASNAWDESSSSNLALTWNIQPYAAKTTVNQAVMTLPSPFTQDYATADVTDMVRDALSSGYLTVVLETAGAGGLFVSRESLSPLGAPYLAIDYSSAGSSRRRAFTTFL